MKDAIKHTVTSKPMAEQCMRDMEAMCKEHGYCVVKITAGGISEAQRALFHVWCRQAAKDFQKRGKEIDEGAVKIWMKAKFLGTEDVVYGNKVLKDQLRHTEDLSVGETFRLLEQMWEYMATDHQIFLPIPEESHYKKLRESVNGQD